VEKPKTLFAKCKFINLGRKTVIDSKVSMLVPRFCQKGSLDMSWAL